MALASQPTAIADLRNRLARVEMPGLRNDALPFGFATIDEHLPGGGLGRGELHEILEGARVGLHPDRVVFCETYKDRDVLPAMEAAHTAGAKRHTV